MPYEQEIPGSGQEIAMVPVSGGSFLMGSSDTDIQDEDEGPQKEVEVDSFWMGKYEISWNQYDLFVREKLANLPETGAPTGDVKLKADAVSLPTPPYIDMSFGMGRDGYPAINMTQYAAVMYAKWLTAKTGNFYRLPTEAEWEYACRAGSESAYHFGNDAAELDKYAWFRSNSDRSYNEVGTLQPNSLGLHDIHGNVAEWTTDQYREDYHEQLEGDVTDNPLYLPTTLYPRSVRGGSWSDDAEELRCTNRRGSIERWKQRDPQLPKSLWWLTDAPFVGFRLVRPKETPSKEEMERYWIDAMEDY
ncbi:MAG: SUMF1/EgtB/PvdO family nonheme iron enzyme [Balneolales bacterium]